MTPPVSKLISDVLSYIDTYTHTHAHTHMHRYIFMFCCLFLNASHTRFKVLFNFFSNLKFGSNDTCYAFVCKILAFSCTGFLNFKRFYSPDRVTWHTWNTLRACKEEPRHQSKDKNQEKKREAKKITPKINKNNVCVVNSCSPSSVLSNRWLDSPLVKNWLSNNIHLHLHLHLHLPIPHRLPSCSSSALTGCLLVRHSARCTCSLLHQ